ncbi:MAG: hypothetical protein V3V08_01855 [Nannocystaceae bacterium]
MSGTALARRPDGTDHCRSEKGGSEFKQYRVHLTPDQLKTLFARHDDIDLRTGDDPPERAETPTQRRFLAVQHTHSILIHHAKPLSEEGGGTGLMGHTRLIARMQPIADGASVDISLVHTRTTQSLLRWLGLVATTGVGLAWVYLGGGQLGQRALFFTVFVAFILPVLYHDILHRRWGHAERRELLSLVHSLLGPVAIGNNPGERTPFRRLRGLPPDEDE